MSGPAGVGSSTGPLRVRPPSPLSRQARIIVALVAAVVVLGGAALVVGARANDVDADRGQDWNGSIRIPRAASVDRFDRAGPLGEVDGFGSWQVGGAGWAVDAGALRPMGDGAAAAWVAVETGDVLAYAQFERTEPGTGLLLGAPGSGTAPVVRLVVNGDGSGWDLIRSAGGTDEMLGSFADRTSHVAVQLVRQGDRVVVTIEQDQRTVDVPGLSAADRTVGLVSGGPGTVVDLFGYLPLPAG